MPGDWRDLSLAWFVDALVESVKLDAMAENEHNLLLQGGVIFSDKRDTEIDPDISGGGQTGMFRIDSDNIRFVEFPVYIPDRCPWNRIIFKVWFESAQTTSKYEGYRVSVGDALPTVGTQLFSVEAGTDLFDGEWNTLHIEDISSWTAGMHVIALYYQHDGGTGDMRTGPIEVRFASSADDLVA